jgi:TolB-like protein
VPAGDDDTVAGSPYTAETAAAIPALIAGRYQIVRWLGGGGMGRVYEVTDVELGENVALKMLHGNLHDEALARFRREVRLTRKIQHTNIARMFDIGETEDGDRFLTMELVEGEALTASLGRGLPWPELQQIAVQICAGLAAAHDKGVIHRDLKPDNVLIERAKSPSSASGVRTVLTDFGIARSSDDTQGNVTQTGMVVGTPRYMAPEQLAGQQTDERSDLFSLGVMLYELASGMRPWGGDNPIAIAVAMATQPMQPLIARGAPAGFTSIIESLLAVDPTRRPASAAEVGAKIAALTSVSTTPGPAVVATAPTHIAPAVVTHVHVHADECTVAVLPFAASTADDYIASGMREDLIDLLSTSPGLRVRPAGGESRAGADPRDSGRELGVDHVVIGSLRRTPTGLRIAARLVGVADGFQIWAHRIDCGDAEVLAVGDQLGRAIVTALSSQTSHRHSPPTDPRAVELFLRARNELRRFWGDHALEASKLLEEAAQLAPSSPQIAGLLACSTVLAWAKLNKPELLEKSRRYVERGLALDHPEAYLAASQLHWNLGDLEASARDLRIGLERAPMNALAHEAAGRLLVEIDHGPAGRHHLETAIGLDASREDMISADLARVDALEGDWASAERRVAKLIANPDIAMKQFGGMMALRMLIWTGQIDRLGDLLDRGEVRIPHAAAEFKHIVSRWRADRVFDQATWDRTIATLCEPDRPKRMTLTIFARAIEVAAMLGQHEHAIQGLQLAADRGLSDIVWLDRCPVLAAIHDPRWRACRDRIAVAASRVHAALRGASPSGTLIGTATPSRRA